MHISIRPIFAVAAVIACFMGTANAEMLLNANLDESNLYDNLESSNAAINTNQSIRPFSYQRAEMFLLDDKRVRLIRAPNPIDDGNMWRLKPLNSFKTKFFYTNEERTFLEGQSGVTLRKGINLLAFEDGFISYGDDLTLYYQLKQVADQNTVKNQLFRGYLKYRFTNWSIELGKDNVSIGPGEYGGLLLSDNVEPYPLVKLGTETPLYFGGDWDFVLLNAWLPGKRNDHSNPQLLVGALSYKPFNWLELDLARSDMYGGDGQPEYTLDEYPRLFLGTNANSANKFGGDNGYASWSLSFYLPFNRWFENVHTVKMYYEEVGTDVNTFWQTDYPNGASTPSLVRFNKSSFMEGIYVATEENIFRLERAAIHTNFYWHWNYTDGYQYNGLALGSPYGTNSESYLFKHLHYFNKDFWGQYKIGQYTSPAYHIETPGLTMTRTFLELQAEKKIGIYRLGGFARVDMTKNYDETISSNPIAYISQRTVSPNDMTFMTVGASLNIDF